MADDKPPQSDPTSTNASSDASAGDAAGGVGDAASQAEQALGDAKSAAESIDAQTATPVGAAPSSAPPASAASPDAAAAPPNLDLPSFQQLMADVQASGIELLRDVELNVKIELGRTDMLVEDVLALSEGSVVELNKLAGDPVDVYVNDRLIARGEVLVLSENFGVRISEIVSDTIDEDEAAEPEPVEQPVEAS